MLHDTKVTVATVLRGYADTKMLAGYVIFTLKRDNIQLCEKRDAPP